MRVFETYNENLIVQVDQHEDWSPLLHVCRDYLTLEAVEKLRKTLSRYCRTVVIEYDYVCKDYRDTYANYYAKKFAKYPNSTIRLLFFAKTVSPDDIWNVAKYADSFIGYSVIRPTRIKCIGRTILRPEFCRGVYGDICVHAHRINFLGVDLAVEGFPFISQDTDVTRCAHACCWMSLRHFSERQSIVPEAYPYRITQMTHDLSRGRLIPSKGLVMAQISEILTNYGLYPEIYARTLWESKETGSFDRLLYWYIESGIPLILGLPNHAVTAFGHISAYGSDVVPEDGTFIWSNQYVLGLVVNDDNHLPYQIIPTQEAKQGDLLDERRANLHPKWTLDQVTSFIVPLHEKIYLTAEKVATLTRNILMDPEIGLPVDERKDLVIRQFLTPSRDFKSLRRNPGFLPPHGLERLYASLPMPKYIWVSELSTKQTYSERQEVVGEILWDATASPDDLFAFLSIHYPKLLVVNNRDSMADDPKDMVRHKLPGSVAYAAYRSNLKEVPIA